MAKKKPRRFAEGTSVDVSKSRMEVEQLLTRHQAAAVLIGTDSRTSVGFVGFELGERQYRLFVPKREPTGRAKKDTAEQLERERWRALLLLLKAKLEVVAAGMASVEQEFLAYMVLPNGNTVGAELAPRLEQAFERNEMPKLLPEGM